jgi:hypothetical protein
MREHMPSIVMSRACVEKSMGASMPGVICAVSVSSPVDYLGHRAAPVSYIPLVRIS